MLSGAIKSDRGMKRREMLSEAGNKKSGVVLSATCVVLLLVLTGCNREGVKLTEVRGKVTADGQPILNASVVFRPISGGRPSLGTTDSAGRYRMKYAEGVWGTLVGRHAISVSTAVEPDSDSSDPEKQAGRPETIAPEYNVATALEVDVTPGASGEYEIAVETQKVN